MSLSESRRRVTVAGALSLATIALVASLAAAGLGLPASAQGQNKNIVEKPSRAVACPSGWRTPNGNTALCEPMGSTSPKIYAKNAKDSCADGYFEVYRVWCSTKK